jgi:hypothetical protein
MMTDDQRRRWKERYRNAPVKNLQASLANASPEHQRLINELIDEIRHAAGAPAQQRFYKDYEQRERRHRQLIWCTLIGCVIGAVIGAAATSLFSSRSQGNGVLPPARLAVATPAPSPTEAPAVATSSPTLAESVPTLEEEGSTPEESPPTEEAPTSEESPQTEEPLTPEELVPAPEESVPTPKPQEP